MPADFELQLFASELDVVKPIYLAWVERGRAWVVETRDYPHGLLPAGEPGQDTNENLEISPMPLLGVLLKEQELADILAFLATLTTAPKDGVTVPVKKASEFE